MHGLNTIKRLNRTEQDFIDHVLSTPTPDVNLLKVWQDWKEEQNQTQREYINESVQVHPI
jgi:hypothetical protein